MRTILRLIQVNKRIPIPWLCKIARFTLNATTIKLPRCGTNWCDCDRWREAAAVMAQLHRSHLQVTTVEFPLTLSNKCLGIETKRIERDRASTSVTIILIDYIYQSIQRQPNQRAGQLRYQQHTLNISAAKRTRAMKQRLLTRQRWRLWRANTMQSHSSLRQVSLFNCATAA